ncbi:MAG: hypothetical protein WC364_12140 [Eubacteriales bacterium]|jgi:hypothetical protein
MTKIQAVQQYSNRRIRDVWVKYGSKELPATTVGFIANDIFRLTAAGTIFDGALMMSIADETLATVIDWAAYERESLTLKTIQTSTTHVIHPTIYCLMLAAELAAIPEPYDPDFIPFPDQDPILIEENELTKILKDVGVPFITLEELEFTREDILENIVKPAMQEYFKWYPIVTIERQNLFNNAINIPIPPWAFTAKRVYVNPGYPVNSNIANPTLRYFDEVLLAASSRGAWANPSINYKKKQGYVGTGDYSTFILEKAARQGAVNYGTRQRLNVNVHRGSIVGYCNKTGTIEIEWAQWSNDWNDILFNRRSEVRKLATAYALRAFGMLRSQQSSDSPGRLDYSKFLERADKLEEEVTALWQSAPKVALIRS